MHVRGGNFRQARPVAGAPGNAGVSPTFVIPAKAGIHVSRERGHPARIFVHGRFPPGPPVRCGRDTSVPGEAPARAPPEAGRRTRPTAASMPAGPSSPEGRTEEGRG